MKITRKKLIRLIKESMIKPGIPGLDTDSYEKTLGLARHSDPEVRQQADHLAGGMGYEGSFSGDLDAYNNPVTYGTVGVNAASSHPHNNDKFVYIEKEVMIPPGLVEDVVSSHQALSRGGYSGNFVDAAENVFFHISQEVAPNQVISYGLKTRGYRAKEFNDAMNAVGDYL